MTNELAIRILTGDTIGTTEQTKEAVTMAVRALSNVVERKKGKWIRITQGAIPEQYICPFCHRTVESYGVEELLSIRYPYCHCGADMREEKTDVI